jgi:hypothetical protein
MELKKIVAIVSLLVFSAVSYWYGEHKEAKAQERAKLVQQQARLK